VVAALSAITLLGLFFDFLFKRMKLPGLLGMLLLGILMGPNILNVIDENIMRVSSDLRTIALIIILLRAGLGISKRSLNRVGRIVLKISFLPGLLEGFCIAVAARFLLGFSFIEGGVLGFIIAAVSPAVVVPKMLSYLEKGIGTDKDIPTLILAGASIDDVFAVTMFSTFLGLYSGRHMNIGVQIMSIPLSIILGIICGAILGNLMIKMFNKHNIRDTKKVLIILGVAMFLTTLERALENTIQIAGLLGVMTIGFLILEKKPDIAKRMARKLDKIWIFAEVLLFVLVGAQVDISVAFQTGLKGMMLIGAGLLARSAGVLLSTAETAFNKKEKLFCVFAFIPKATVQAAVGAVPLALGLPSGEVILALSVLSIVITAPLGSFLIRASAHRLLTPSEHREGNEKDIF